MFSEIMEVVPIEVFGIQIEVPFLHPQGVEQAQLEAFGAQLCDRATGLKIRPEQIRFKKWDALFGFELSAQFFGENGTLVRTAEHVKFGVRNARTAADWSIICDALVRFYTLMDFPEESLTALSVHAHAKFDSASDLDRWLSRFAYSPLIARPAALGYVQIPDWEKDIRVLIEQSNVVPAAAFLMWDTQFPNHQDWETFFASLTAVMENSANLFDLGFEPLRQQV